MKFRNPLILLLPWCVAFFSCTNQVDKELFNGEIHDIDAKNTIDKDVIAKHVPLEGDYTGTIAVYDSLLVCWEPTYQDYLFNVFNVDTGKEIGYFCPKGQGPDEFANANFIYQFLRRNNDVVALFDGDWQSWAFWNLTKSCQTGKTVYDTIVSHRSVSNLFFFYLPDGDILHVIPSKSATISLIDESYEYLDGILKEDIPSEREEIGDVMINVFMNLCIHQENEDFLPQDAINEVCNKLIRRHPHVFGNEKADSASEVLSLWNSVKENVEGHKDKVDSFFSHIPTSLPPLEASYEIQKKLKKVGFDWPEVSGVVAKVEEELEEVNEAIAEGDENHLEMELGDLLFSVVNLCRFMKIRPNVALHRCNEKVKARFQHLFDMAKERGIAVDKDHVKELNELWEEAKKTER